MEKQIISVPKGIRFISDWEGFSLPDNPTIINKSITGCGFTEYCIRNDQNIILCSPRRILLENKESQHEGEVFYVRNEIEPILGVDKDLSSDKKKKNEASVELSKEDLTRVSEDQCKLRDEIRSYYFNCQVIGKPCKILVTYDSFRHVKEALGVGTQSFYIVVDEFQSIFTDSRFKSDTEMEFMSHLQEFSKVSYVSATPMLDKYLEMLDEFKNLPYYELDWITEDRSRVFKPLIEVKSCQSIIKVAQKIIGDYLNGHYEKYCYQDINTNETNYIESRELVIYVNSVKNICDIIKKCGLTLDNTNILCANTLDNQKKLKAAFKSNGFIYEKGVNPIGKVPRQGELHKMFTLCTRTVYLGADFYSTNARSLILSDANVDCLAVDISLDLPQILGRQRLIENPWKNRAEMYFKYLSNKNQKSQEEFMEIIQRKMSRTKNLLEVYDSTENSFVKFDLAAKWSDAMNNYLNDYISINRHSGTSIIPVFNNLVMVSELRAFEIQQVDYKDRFSVFNSIITETNSQLMSDVVNEALNSFDNLSMFTEKMKYLCDISQKLSSFDLDLIFSQVPLIYKNYFNSLGAEKIRSLGYQKSRLESEYMKIKVTNAEINFLIEVRSLYKVGERIPLGEIKSKLQQLYDAYGLISTAKAKDIEKYYNVQIIRFPKDPITGKRDQGYEILSLK